jgi:hypothetical protein
MPDPVKIPIRSSTQDHLEVEDILDNIIILKDGSCCLVLATTAINFGLLSENEQDATIYAYAALLNSLTFSIEIVVRSKRKDVTSYLKLLDTQINKQTNKLLKDQMEKYRKFVEETVKKNNVLDKSFYVIIPFSALEMGASKNISQALNKRRGLPFPKEYILDQAKMNLFPKRDQIARQFNRLGLHTRQVNTQEAIQLLYDIYNPSSGFQKLASSKEYSSPFVVPASEKPQTAQGGQS